MHKEMQMIGMSFDDLKNLVGQVIKTELEAVKKHLQPKQPNEYLTRKEVSEMLKIDLSSVHNWSKRGILIPHQIGNRVYYKLQEVENAIVKLKRGKDEQ
ncbi:helix-turn-helix domain-containing protein [Flavobacteriaceae bacterium]|nr:helix-turn-helix domain-containing protein [Flavobacteriaceae bacterium]